MNRLIWQSLHYSSTLPVRGALAVAAAMRAITLVFSAQALAADPVYSSLFALASAREWAAIFAINALLLTWRIFEHRPRVGVSRLVNATTCALWTVYIVGMCKARGFLAPDSASDIAMTIAAAWCALRTDLNVNDRESA